MMASTRALPMIVWVASSAMRHGLVLKELTLYILPVAVLETVCDMANVFDKR